MFYVSLGMDFSLFYQLRNKQSRWIDVIFYSVFALLIATVLCYGFFAFRVYFQNQQINELDKKILAYNTVQQKAYEKEVLDYKKKIDDYAIIINSHKISSNVFNFIEKKTLPNVWFSNLNVSEVANEIDLSGESENMKALSSQVQIFEESKDYIKNITVLDSHIAEHGKINFNLRLSLDPKIFAYLK